MSSGCTGWAARAQNLAAARAVAIGVTTSAASAHLTAAPSPDGGSWRRHAIVATVRICSISRPAR